MTFKIKTPNPQYNGVTEGVAFASGIGFTEDINTRNVLVNDYKYEDTSEVLESKDPEPTREKTIDEMTVPELEEKAKELNLSGFSKLNRVELVALIKGDPSDKEGGKKDPPDEKKVDEGKKEEDNQPPEDDQEDNPSE